MAKKQEETVDFKIHIPEFEAKLRPTKMMFDPTEYRNRTREIEQQVVDLGSAFQLLMLEVISNRRQINELQRQLETLAKGT